MSRTTPGLSPIFGAAEVGRLAFVQGVRDTQEIAKRDFELQQVMPLEVETLRLDIENGNFNNDRLNPLRLQSMRLANRNQQLRLGLDEYKLQTLERNNTRRMQFESDVMDDFNLLFDGENGFDAERGQEFMSRHGPRLALDRDPYFKGIGETVRQELGLPEETDYGTRFLQAMGAGEVGEMRKLKAEIAVAAPWAVGTETRRTAMIRELDEAIVRIEPPITVQSPSQRAAQAGRTLQLQGDLGSARLRAQAQRARVKWLRDREETEEDIRKEAKTLEDLESQVQGLEIQLGIQPVAGLGGPELLTVRREIEEMKNAGRRAQQRFIDSGGTDRAAVDEADRLFRAALRAEAEFKANSGGVGPQPQATTHPLLPPKAGGAPVDPAESYLKNRRGSPFVTGQNFSIE